MFGELLGIRNMALMRWMKILLNRVMLGLEKRAAWNAYAMPRRITVLSI